MGKMFDALKRAEQEKEPPLEDGFRKDTPEEIVFDDKLAAYFQPMSMAAEQLRRLRTIIMKAGVEGHPPKTLLVTSAVAGEGKSLIAANLAMMLAVELHSHALLVDGDLRNPSLGKMFGLQEKKGLANYLNGEAEIEDLFIKTPIERLSLICSGRAAENPVELMGSNKMKTLIEELRSRYEDRFIIFDSSPILATTEPSVLYKMVDGVILIVRAGSTPRESVLQAMRVFEKGKILGVVLNNLEFKTRAMIQRNFGARHYYYDYRGDKPKTDERVWKKWWDIIGGEKGMPRKIGSPRK